MKHLKTYKLFEAHSLTDLVIWNSHDSDDDEVIYNYVNDLFAEIKSNDVRIFTASHFPSRYRVVIGEYSDQGQFSYSEVVSEIQHMISYFANEWSMKLGDVDITGGPSNYKRIPNRVSGWEKLKFLETMKDEKCIFSLTINFMGGTAT